jgi:hypothetical protein
VPRSRNVNKYAIKALGNPQRPCRLPAFVPFADATKDDAEEANGLNRAHVRAVKGSVSSCFLLFERVNIFFFGILVEGDARLELFKLYSCSQLLAVVVALFARQKKEREV